MCCVEGHSCPFLSDTYLDLGTIGVGYIDEIQYCAEELNGWIVRTENCVEGHHRTSLDVIASFPGLVRKIGKGAW